MYAAAVEAETILNTAIAAVKRGDDLQIALDTLNAPIYVTDAEGTVTFFNRACIGFTGRIPVVGKDRWCVTWKLYTEEGEFLPHDRCPMAVAILDRRPVRGVSAVAERPDGTRVNFLPFPTPLLSEDDEFLGAINMLLDVTDERQIGDLRAQAARCLRLAAAAADPDVMATLRTMAAEYDAKADEMDRARG